MGFRVSGAASHRAWAGQHGGGEAHGGQSAGPSAGELEPEEPAQTGRLELGFPESLIRQTA